MESGENGISVGCVQGCVGLKQPYIDVIRCILTSYKGFVQGEGLTHKFSGVENRE